MGQVVQQYAVGKGWLSPDGQLTECYDYDHTEVAELIFQKPEGRLLALGWVHVGYASGTRSKVAPTQSQINALFDLMFAPVTSEVMREVIEGYLRKWEAL